MIRVSNLDAGMLYAETPEMPMHTMGVLILDPEEAAGDFEDTRSTFESARQLFRERVHLIPPFRRRMVQGPLQIGDPHWIEELYGFTNSQSPDVRVGAAKALAQLPTQDAITLLHRLLFDKVPKVQPADLAAAAGSFDLILSTVNVKLDWNLYLGALKARGRLHIVGATLDPLDLSAFALVV